MNVGCVEFWLLLLFFKNFACLSHLIPFASNVTFCLVYWSSSSLADMLHFRFRISSPQSEGLLGNGEIG